MICNIWNKNNSYIEVRVLKHIQYILGLMGFKDYLRGTWVILTHIGFEVNLKNYLL